MRLLPSYRSLFPCPTLGTPESLPSLIWPACPPQAASPIGRTQHHVEPKETEQLPPEKFVDAPAPQQQQLRETAESRIGHAGCVRDSHRGAGPVGPKEMGLDQICACGLWNWGLGGSCKGLRVERGGGGERYGVTHFGVLSPAPCHFLHAVSSQPCLVPSLAASPPPKPLLQATPFPELLVLCLPPQALSPASIPKTLGSTKIPSI